jgi:hypothetical protein
MNLTVRPVTVRAYKRTARARSPRRLWPTLGVNKRDGKATALNSMMGRSEVLVGHLPEKHRTTFNSIEQLRTSFWQVHQEQSFKGMNNENNIENYKNSIEQH